MNATTHVAAPVVAAEQVADRPALTAQGINKAYRRGVATLMPAAPCRTGLSESSAARKGE